MEQLTPNQQKFYNALTSYVREHYRWPSNSRLMELLGVRSKNSIFQYYSYLIDKGYIKKDSQDNYTFTEPVELWKTDAQSDSTIPVLGEISAGSLNEAVEADLGEISIRDFFPNTEEVFALRVRGMSMKGLGLSTGDKVILSKTDLKNGDVGAVLYNGKTSLKRAYKEEGQVRLEPANPNYDDIIIEPGEFEEVTVLGKYLGYVNSDGLVKSPF